MTGYVVPQKSELKLREFEVYNAYYCGICHALRDRYGQLPRLLLTYDAVFLAMLFAALSGEPDQFHSVRCPTHPGKRKNVTDRLPAMDYAADMLLLLGWFNLKDDLADEKKLRGLAGTLLLRRAYGKIRRAYPAKATALEGRIDELHRLEAAGCAHLDEAAEPFARLMEEVMDFPGAAAALSAPRGGVSPEAFGQGVQVAFRKIGYHLGKWIYLVDAIDDLGHDRKSGSYNPILCWMNAHVKKGDGFLAAAVPAKQDWADLTARLRLDLRLCLAEIATVMDLIPLRKNGAILENIVYVGLNAKTEEVLSKLSGAEEGQSDSSAKENPWETHTKF